MRILLFICLLFVGCYHEKEPIGDTPIYRFYTASFTSTDSCIIMENYGEKFYLRIEDSETAIKYTPVLGQPLKITITFEAIE